MGPSAPDRRRLVLFLVETGLLPLTVLAAEAVRRVAGLGGPPVPYATLLLPGVVSALVLQFCLFYADLYDDRALRSRVAFFLTGAQSFAMATLGLALLYYLVPSLRIAPATLLLSCPLSAATVLAWHSLHRWVVGGEALADNVLILGTGATAQQIAVEMLRRTPLGYRVVGFLGEHPAEVGRRLVNPSVVGTTADLLALVDRLRVNLIVVALEDRRGRLPVDELLQCRLAGVSVEDAPSFFERLTGKILVSDLRPSWLVFSPGFRKPKFLDASKRALELAAAVVGLAVVGPIIGALAAVIRASSPGPAFFRQERVGLRGQVFELVKLRTMRLDAESGTGPVWASAEDDPRITALGRVLRKLRLDELPQILNVLRGEMSFVGPRPERPHFVDKLRQVIPYYDERHAVRPGITGWAQVKFGYASTIEDAERKLQFDLYYVKNMSLLLDLAILLETAKVMVLQRGSR
jgi:sugar transferase (PEP-CTERM system associated)